MDVLATPSSLTPFQIRGRSRWTSADVAVHSGLINYSICFVLLVNKQSLHICSGIASAACLFTLPSSLSLRLTRNYGRDPPDALARPSSRPVRTYLRRRWRGRDGCPSTFLAPREDDGGEGEIRGDDVEGEEETRRRRKTARRGRQFYWRGRGISRTEENTTWETAWWITIRTRSRARIYPRARPAIVFEELLEKDFCGFTKFINIASSFEELLEMLLALIT